MNGELEHVRVHIERFEDLKKAEIERDELRSEVDLLKRDLWTAYLEVKRLGYRLMKYEPVEDPMPGVADDTQTR